MTNFKTLVVVTATMLTLSGAAHSAGHSQTIVDIAAANERFSTLVAAVTAAGLVETLSSEGPFTVFAPLNDAFSALPESTVETLLIKENLSQLSNILTYHVVSGAVMSSDLATGSSLVGTVLADNSICITSDMGVTIADFSG